MRNLLKPIYFTKYDTSIIRSTYLLARALVHFDETNLRDIDTRTYHVTLHLNDSSNLPKFMAALYTKIRKSFSFKDQRSHRHFGNRIAFIAGFDVLGSRYSHHIRDFERPHVHAMFILPRCLATTSSIEEEPMLRRLRAEIRKMDEVIYNPLQLNKGRRILLKKVGWEKSIIEQIDYITKLEKKNHDFPAELVRPYIYPFERNEKAKMRSQVFKERLQRLCHELHTSKAKFFRCRSNLAYLGFQKKLKEMDKQIQSEFSRQALSAYMQRTIIGGCESGHQSLSASC